LTQLINLLNAKGWGVWEFEEETSYSHMGFTLIQISDPRDSSDTVRYHFNTSKRTFQEPDDIDKDLYDEPPFDVHN
jgi:hypothetical protein